nr:ATP-binding protein [Streptomyces sp. Xyl84]
MTTGASSVRTVEEEADGAAARASGPQLRRRLGRADLRAVPEARRALRELLHRWGPGERSEVAELLTSELVTNALVHTDDDAILTATVSPSGLRVEVRDFVARGPRPRGPAAAEDTNGRGLFLIESLADDWGVCAHEVGKSVWFELGAQQAA